jgi:hypothetical protein
MDIDFDAKKPAPVVNFETNNYSNLERNLNDVDLCKNKLI